jgi:hypothetical protein
MSLPLCFLRGQLHVRPLSDFEPFVCCFDRTKLAVQFGRLSRNLIDSLDPLHRAATFPVIIITHNNLQLIMFFITTSVQKL